MERICIVGLGYIGLPTAALAAQHFTIIGVDIDSAKREAIAARACPYDEPELQKSLNSALDARRLHVSACVLAADTYIIAVPTPFYEDKTADLRAVYGAIDSVLPVLAAGGCIIIESTIPVGTTRAVGAYIQEKTGLRAGTDIFIAHAPERVLPGNIMHELIYNDRIIGGLTRACVDRAKQFYKPFVRGALYLTDAESAELVKLVENSSRDVALAFAYQVASMARAIERNPHDIIELANKHPRVNILRPTVGVGGHCIAVDPWFLIQTFSEQTHLLRAARMINDEQPQHCIEMIQTERARWKEQLGREPRLALLGITYKPDVEDIRESPALSIARAITTQYPNHTLVYDPHAASVAGFAMAPSLQYVLEHADALVVLVAHRVFKQALTQIASKPLLDLCALAHQPKISFDGEYRFWPAQRDVLPREPKQEQLCAK